MTHDAFFAVVQANKIFNEGIERPLNTSNSLDNSTVAAPVKGGKQAAAVVVEETEPELPLADEYEANLLEELKFSDKNERLRSLDNIVQEMDEANFFTQKSTVTIFRYEDVIFNIFPHLAHLKRRGLSTKEIFIQNDPFSNKIKDPLDKNADSQPLIGDQKKSDIS